MKETPLANRLAAAAAAVRQDAVFADIGTDHAYLPLFLLTGGRVRFALCTDIAEGPLATARAHAAAFPHPEKIVFLRTDGLHGTESYHPTDIAICGMGGELIASILSDSDYVRQSGVRLILQPMTRQEHLRRSLAENGFRISQETYVKEGKSGSECKYYVTFTANYEGISRQITEEEAWFGDPAVYEKNAAYYGYLRGKERALSRAFDGLTRGGENAEEQARLLVCVRTLLADAKEN